MIKIKVKLRTCDAFWVHENRTFTDKFFDDSMIQRSKDAIMNQNQNQNPNCVWDGELNQGQRLEIRGDLDYLRLR